MLQGVLLGFVGYALFSCSDAVIKSFSGKLSIFEIAFFVTLFAAIPLVLSRPKEERWRDFWRPHHPVGVNVRAICGVLGGMCSIYAFTHVPLAEAYALIFLLPLVVTILSAIFLKEPVGWRRISAVLAGFAGVIIVLRPGFREIELAHLAGGAVALLGATGMIILRHIAKTERRTSLVAVGYCYSLTVNGILMLPTFVMPEGTIMLRLVAIGCMAGVAQLCTISASRLAPANMVAPTQYSQILWAVTLGAVFYAEYPDRWTLLGLAVIAVAGLFTFLREEQRFGWNRGIPVMRNRPGT
jgi:S-adenosylmethionine uptake transporter